MLAEKLGIDPLEFRRMNSLKPGQTKATGMVTNQWPFVELCDAIKAQYDRAKREVQAFNARGEKLKRGVGFGAHSFGIGGAGDSAKLAIESILMMASLFTPPWPTRVKVMIPC